MKVSASSFHRPLWLVTILCVGLLAVTSCSTSKTDKLATADRYYTAIEYDKAEIEYKNVLQADGQNAHAIGRLGLIYLDQGRLRQAVPYLMKAVELQPENLEARSKLGTVYLAFGKAAEARTQADYILSRQPTDDNAPILLVQASAGTPADLNAAGDSLKQLPATAQQSPAVITALGIIELRTNRLKEAEATFQQALAVNPKFAAAHSALGALYLSQGKKEAAEQSLKSAFEHSPLRSGKGLQYAQYKLQSGDRPGARTLLQDLTQRAPDYLPALALLAELEVGDKRYDESAVLVGKILAKDGSHPDALLLSGRLKLVRGEPVKAGEELEKLLALYPQHPNALYFLGVAYASVGDKTKAVDRLNQSIKLAPTAEAILALAGINLRNGDYSAVVVGLKPLLQQQPGNFAARMLLADAYRAQGNVDEALAIYRLSATDFPANPQSSFQIGLTYLKQRKWPEAQQAFTDTLQRSPAFFPALEQLVGLDLAARRTDAAFERVTTEIARDPKSSGAQLLLGQVQFAKGNKPAAEAAFKQAIELKPDNATAYFQIAQFYVATQQQQQALASLAEATTRNPKDTKAWLTVGLIQEQQNNFPAAREAYEKILAIDPKAGLALNNLAYLYSEQFKELEKGYELALRGRELMPDEPHMADTLGWILYQKGQYNRALPLLEDSATALPTSADVAYHLGMTRYMAGLEAPAKEALQRALELNPNLSTAAEARRRLAVLAVDSTSGGATAIAFLEKSLTGAADDPVARARLAALYESTGEPEKAIAAYQTAIAANPTQASPWLGLARLHASRRESAKALEAAKSARKLAPNDPAVARALGTIANDMGDSVWAASLLQEAARKQPDDFDLLYETSRVLYHVGQVGPATEMMELTVAPAKGSANRLFSAESTAGFGHAAEAKQFLTLVKLAESPESAQSPTIDEALKRDPNDLAALMARGAAQEKALEFNAAKQTYEQALARSAEFTPAKLRLSLLAVGQPAFDAKALEWAQQARTAYPNDLEAAKALGIHTYRKGGAAARAVTLLQEAVNAREQDATSRYFLGLAQLEVKSPAAAKTLEKALTLDLSPTWAADVREKLAKLAKDAK